ncbi:MAG: UvrD-helicase domain-containing protein [Robiginitalea sp.]|uniref:UvrD-helicase domain-containing protein n=1 Tax=Robiginitalea sp. TaxID=1902411 RepID=UPI003C7191DB
MDQHLKAFRIFDASAGSGKTFTLAREYLCLILQPGAGRLFRRILAITFTNKAVAELKNRILDSLMEFASLSPENSDTTPMFEAVKAVLHTDRAALIFRSQNALQQILHNYAFFDVSTIDKFNQRVLRTFARDLDIPTNFEVVLETDVLLEEAVNNLIARAGTDKQLTDILVDFALEKTEDDRSWDISDDLLKMGRLLFDETHYQALDTFSQKEIDDFLRLKNTLQAYRVTTEKMLRNTAKELLDCIDSNGLEFSDFSGKYFPNFIQKISEGQFDLNTDSKWIEQFGSKPLYPGKASVAVKQILDGESSTFVIPFEQIIQGLYHRDFLINAYKNIAPFAVLGLLQQELKKLRDEEGYLPIAAFNTIIAKEIANQPAPYIYERLGERYQHYFIDEFQDTSELQWNNLVPLVSNAIEGEFDHGAKGSIVLVGDAKQAIYRWRGGKAEQFLNLIDGIENPFPVQAENQPLPKNFRSHKPLVEFNNSFFSHISTFMSGQAYSELFVKGNRQEYHHDSQGLVHLEFIPSDAENENDLYAARTKAIIQELTDKGYAYRDICILTRRGKDGVFISQHLMQEGIPVSSSETLLLKNHPGVQFLITLLKHLLVPEDKNHIFDLLLYLSAQQEDRHTWINTYIHKVEEVLSSYQFYPAQNRLRPVYEVMEIAIRQFDLGGQKDAYLIFLMDLIHEIGQSRDPSIQTFLEHWKIKEDKLSISAPEGFNAVTLMTVHKSKGLEFPVVLFPFANSEIYYEKNPKLWLPVSPERFSGFNTVLVTKKKALLKYDSPAPQDYSREQEKLELDAYNLLYVAHTRAIKALYIISKNPGKKQGASEPKTYGEVYFRFLSEKGLWDDQKSVYSFGALDLDHAAEPSPVKVPVDYRYTARDRISLKLVSHPDKYRDTAQSRAMQYGNILHYALSLVLSAADIEKAIERLIKEGMVRTEESFVLKQRLESVAGHPRLSQYFGPDVRVLNEQEIFLKNGVILRPDRLVFSNDTAVIMDYKTGRPEEHHRIQVQAYREAIQAMGYIAEAAIVVYIDDNLVTPEFI